MLVDVSVRGSTGKAVEEYLDTIGITADELHAHVFGLTLVAVSGDRSDPATQIRAGLRLVPPAG